MSAGLRVVGEVERPLDWVAAEGPLASILAAAGPHAGTEFATVTARDGLFRASIPLRTLETGRLRGGRLDIPGTPTRCWNVKDVAVIEVTTDEASVSVEARQRQSRPRGA